MTQRARQRHRGKDAREANADQKLKYKDKKTLTKGIRGDDANEVGGVKAFLVR